MVVKRGVNDHGIVADGRALPRQRPHPALHRVHGRRHDQRLADRRRRSGGRDRRARSTPSCRSSRCEPTTRRGREALALPRRRRRDRRHRLGHPAVLRRLHAGPALRRRQALHLPLRRQGHDLRAPPARRRERRRARATHARVWRAAPTATPSSARPTRRPAEDRDVVHRRLRPEPGHGQRPIWFERPSHAWLRMCICDDVCVSHGHDVDLAYLTADTARIVAETMQALATPSRVRILSRLGAGPCSVTELARDVGMEQPAVSQQLRVLRHLGLVVGERRGRQTIYELHDDHVGSCWLKRCLTPSISGSVSRLTWLAKP